LLGENIQELIEENGDSWITDDNRKLHPYVMDEIDRWLSKRYPQKNDFHSIRIKEILGYLVREGMISSLPDDSISSDSNCNNYELLYEINTNEKSYGDKHLGTSFPDGGTFGSLPLYDDYSEDGES